MILIQDISMTEKEIESFQKFVARKGWTAYGMEGYITEKKHRRGGVMILARKEVTQKQIWKKKEKERPHCC